MSSMYSLTLSKALGRSRSNKTWRKANGEPRDTNRQPTS
jgi:hypothetical protein